MSTDTAGSAGVTETASSATAMTVKVNVRDPDPVLPTSGLFRVEVDGLLGFSLIPLTDLARDLAGAWMGGDKKAGISGWLREKPWSDGNRARGAMCVERFSVRVEPGNILSNGGDPFDSGQRLSDEERAVALAAVQGMREAKNRITVERLRKATPRSKRGAR